VGLLSRPRIAGAGFEWTTTTAELDEVSRVFGNLSEYVVEIPSERIRNLGRRVSGLEMFAWR
jgi:hypothetical protein